MLRGLREIIHLCKQDSRRYTYLLRNEVVHQRGETAELLRAAVLCQGLQATIIYRVGHAFHTWRPTTGLGRAVRSAGIAMHFVAQRFNEITTGIYISVKAEIGPGLYIGHFGGVIIGAAVVGENCNIAQNVTLGRDGRGKDRGWPTLQDRVWIGPGAVVAGKIVLGHDSAVGANAVVRRSMPPRSVAVGVPARLKSGQGSFELVAYSGMEDDVARRESLALVSDPLHS